MQDDARNRVLLVDDCLDTCDLLSTAFPHLSFTLAHSFEDGLKLARFEQFDLFLLDNWLRDGSGVELCREIRKNDAGTPVLFLSAAASQSDHNEAMAAGASLYLDKPVDLDRLRSILESVIQGPGARNLKAKAGRNRGSLD